MRQRESVSHKPNGGFNPILSNDQSMTRECRIAEAAYFIAESRGFEGDHALDDWLQAESLIDHAKDARSADLLQL
jgi:hypothetical protein